jgi:hypothetical protein
MRRQRRICHSLLVFWFSVFEAPGDARCDAGARRVSSLAGILQAPDDLVKSREDRIAFASAFDDLHATGSADAFEAMG